MIYVFLWFGLLCISLINKYKGLCLYAVIFVLIILSGIRATSVGVDTSMYLRIYDYISNEDAKYVEPGWYFLNRIVYLIGGGFTLLLFLVAALTLLPLVVVIKKHSSYWLFSLFLYYSMYLYLNTWNGMRQYLAVSIGLLAFSYLCNKKRGAYFISVLVACLFHYSSVVLLLAFFVYNRTFSKKVIVASLFISFMLGLFVLDNSFYSLVAGKYAHYLESQEFGYRTNISGAVVLAGLMNFIVIITLYTFDMKGRAFWFNLFCIGIVFLNLTLRLSLGSRLILFFTSTQILLFPSYLENCKIRPKIFALLWVLIYFSLLFYRNLFDGMGGGGIIPYKTIFY